MIFFIFLGHVKQNTNNGHFLALFDNFIQYAEQTRYILLLVMNCLYLNKKNYVFNI